MGILLGGCLTCEDLVGVTHRKGVGPLPLYIKDGTVVATVDYGDGQCDDIATKTVDGVDHEFKIEKIVMDKMDK